MNIKCILTTLLLFLVFTTNAVAQESKKERLARHKEMASLQLESFKDPKYKYLAIEYTLEQFVDLYLYRANESMSKDLDKEFMDYLYTDSIYTYYLHRNCCFAVNLLKVKGADVDNFVISKLNGQALRKKFVDEIIPESDKTRVNECTPCYKFHDHRKFKYKYNSLTQTIQISYVWHVNKRLNVLLHKEYTAYYNIENHTLDKVKK